MSKILKSVLTEYGMKWAVNRSLYSGKLNMMSKISFTEKLFEKDVEVKRIDIFNFDIKSISKFLSELNENEKSNIISVSDKAVNGIITGFSSTELNYGSPINWHLNPLTGFEKRKDLKWYNISDFDSKVGDIKVIWEASRLTHFLYFCRAYLITKDNKYYLAFSEQLNDWLKNNLYSYGANYKCGQEATLRMMNALISYSIFDDLGLTTSKDKENIKKIVKESYKKVMSNFFYAHKCIKNNHTFTEILGLIVGSWCCDDNKSLNKGYKLMDKEIKNQFLNDGGFTQYSFNYHRFTLQILECLYKVSDKTGIYITETERIKNSVLMLYQVQEENGDVPNYGSNDGALIFPLSSCKYRDFRPALNTMYALIEGKRLYKHGNYDEELIWFGKQIDYPQTSIKKYSSAFHESGYYLFHHQKGFMMIPLQEYKSRPAHMDQLHIDLWHKGINVFCDSGTYSYASELGKQLSSTSAHNTLKLIGVEQMNKSGAFLVIDWTTRKNVIYNDQKFKGSMYSKNGYIHTRTVNKMNLEYEISDEVIEAGKNCESCEVYFHTPCKVKVIANGIELYYKEELIGTIETTGNICIEKSYRSLYYLKKEEINCICIKSDMKNNKCNIISKIKLEK